VMFGQANFIVTGDVTLCDGKCDGSGFRNYLINKECDGVTAQNPLLRQGAKARLARLLTAAARQPWPGKGNARHVRNHGRNFGGQEGASRAVMASLRTCKKCKIGFEGSSIGNYWRPICSNRTGRWASCGLYVILYGWAHGGRGFAVQNAECRVQTCSWRHWARPGPKPQKIQVSRS
jgi:hypothetical protein